MFKNLRRNSKQLLETRRKSSVATPTTLLNKTASISAKTTPRTLNFFDLPAEIRNVVYEDVARNTSIYVPAMTKRAGRATNLPPPSLLLASKQTRQEFIPLLLELSPVAILVKEFNFRNLQRLTSGLYSTELKALRNNQHLTILLEVGKPTKATLDSLRKWLVTRADGLDRLGWRYRLAWQKHSQILPTSTHVHRTNIFIQKREFLRQNLEAMAQLHKDVPEMLRFELEPVIAVFEQELGRIGVRDEEVGVGRDEWAAMMGGVRYRNSSR